MKNLVILTFLCIWSSFAFANTPTNNSEKLLVSNQVYFSPEKSTQVEYSYLRLIQKDIETGDSYFYSSVLEFEVGTSNFEKTDIIEDFVSSLENTHEGSVFRADFTETIRGTFSTREAAERHKRICINETSTVSSTDEIILDIL